MSIPQVPQVTPSWSEYASQMWTDTSATISDYTNKALEGIQNAPQQSVEFCKTSFATTSEVLMSSAQKTIPVAAGLLAGVLVTNAVEKAVAKKDPVEILQPLALAGAWGAVAYYMTEVNALPLTVGLVALGAAARLAYTFGCSDGTCTYKAMRITAATY